MERKPHEPTQLSFLAPEDAQMVHLLRRFVAEAARIYESRTGRPVEDALTISAPGDAYEFLRPEMENLEQEHLRTINLTTKNRIISAPLIYQGTISGTHVRVAEVFRPAVIDNAAALIVAHNHPSGDPAPSSEDVHVTRQIVDVGRLMDIDVLDHIIVGQGSFVSMRERGLGF